MSEEKWVKAFNGFNRDMTCNPDEEEPTCDLYDFIKAQIEYVESHCTNENNADVGKPATADDKGAATAGAYGAATAGNKGAAIADDCGAATARGTVTVGVNSVGTVRGHNVKIRGGLGALLVAAEEKQGRYNIDTWAAAIVDGKTIKPDTWYCVKNGKFVEI